MHQLEDFDLIIAKHYCKFLEELRNTSVNSYVKVEHVNRTHNKSSSFY